MTLLFRNGHTISFPTV